MNKQDNDPLLIKESKFGKGLFAAGYINKGSVLCHIKGKQLKFADTITLSDNESHTLQIDFDKYIYCEPPFLFSNHSCNPNCAINKNLELYALRNIKAGEEIFWDYSTSMLERHWTMKCECGEKNCRKVITDFDLLPQKIQNNYLQMNMVLPFIAEFVNLQLAKTA